MNHFMSRRRKRTAEENGITGTRKSLHLQDCRSPTAVTFPVPCLPWSLSCRYVLSVIMKSIFLFKCNLPTLRLTPLVTLLVLPFALTRLLCYHQRIRPPSSLFVPSLDAVVLSAFPIVWFFGFLYYTEVPSLFFVVSTIVASSENQHWLAALVRPSFLSLCGELHG